jgi:hypothetical protein
MALLQRLGMSQFNACNATVSFGDLVLGSFSKFSDLGQAGFGSLVGPLVAQNRTYTRYLTGFNEIEFNQISNGKFYMRNNLPMGGPFQNGALDVKSACFDVQHCTSRAVLHANRIGARSSDWAVFARNRRACWPSYRAENTYTTTMDMVDL